MKLSRFFRKFQQPKAKSHKKPKSHKARELPLGDREWAMDLHSMQPKSHWDFRCETLNHGR